MFYLDFDSGIPLYKQLYRQIREHVLAGKLPPDSRLPSVRDLAVELSVSRNTVEGAYLELCAEGYIYSKDRSGYFVSALDQGLTRISRDAGTPEPYRLPVPEPAPRFDFHPARLDPDSFPTGLWRKCLVHALAESASDLTRYGEPHGERELRCHIQRYLEHSRGVLCGEDQIVVCSGLQHALEIVAHLLKGEHGSVAVEDPGYHLPRSVFANNSFRVIPVPVGATGLDLDLLRGAGCSIAYVTPSHQLPMGCVMPVANRLKLIEWAEREQGFIIEDDYDSELRYRGNPVPSLQGLRADGNIIYLGTFSKVLSPALRLSYLVLPKSLLASYHRVYRDYFCAVSLLEQRAMSRFMAEGHWNRHLRRMRTLYKDKHDRLLQSLERHFGERATVLGQGAGLHVVLELPRDRTGEAGIIGRAAAKGIYLFPFSHLSAAGEAAPTRLLLGFGGMTPALADEAVALLSAICD